MSITELLFDFGRPLALTVAAYLAFRWLQTQKLKRQHGCQDPPKYPHKDPIFGSDLFRDSAEHAKEFRLLDRWNDRYRTYGKTFSAVMQGTRAICTIDESNLVAITNTNFKDYGVQPMRRDATLPFLGEGVFTMDGPFWEHSRALLRPTFTRANIANLPAFEVHLQKFLNLLPKDGSTVDLKPLLCKLVCHVHSNKSSERGCRYPCLHHHKRRLKFIDTSTEFLFGETLGILNEKPKEFRSPLIGQRTTLARWQSEEFLDAFHYAQKGTARRLQLGKLAFLYRDQKYYESIKVAHAFADRYVDKALEYRRTHLAVKKENVSDDDTPGRKVVLLHDMAMETDNRVDLRNQILHGRNLLDIPKQPAPTNIHCHSLPRRPRINGNNHRQRPLPTLSPPREMDNPPRSSPSPRYHRAPNNRQDQKPRIPHPHLQRKFVPPLPPPFFQSIPI